MYEKDIAMFKLYYFDSEQIDTSTLGDADYETFKEDMEQCFYNALDKYYTDNSIIYNNVVTSNLASENDALEYASSTDSKLYTVQVAGDGATSSPQQATAYLLEIRNLILILIFVWLVVTIYSKIKNLIINYTTKN